MILLERVQYKRERFLLFKVVFTGVRYNPDAVFKKNNILLKRWLLLPIQLARSYQNSAVSRFMISRVKATEVLAVDN